MYLSDIETQAIKFLLQDSFFSKLLFGGGVDLAAKVAKQLHSEPIGIIILVSLAGGLFAAIVNYSIGHLLYRIYRKYTDIKVQKTHREFAEFYDKYGSFILFFSAIIYFGSSMTLFAGFARFGILRALLYNALGNVVYYFFLPNPFNDLVVAFFTFRF